MSPFRTVLILLLAAPLGGCVFAVNTRADTLAERVESLEERMEELEARQGGRTILIQGSGDLRGFCGTAEDSMELDEAEIEAILQEVEVEVMEDEIIREGDRRPLRRGDDSDR